MVQQLGIKCVCIGVGMQGGAKVCLQMGKHQGVCAVVSAGKKMAEVWACVCKCTHNISQVHITAFYRAQIFNAQVRF